MSEAVGHDELKNRVLELMGNEGAGAGKWLAALRGGGACCDAQMGRPGAGSAREGGRHRKGHRFFGAAHFAGNECPLPLVERVAEMSNAS